MENKIIETTFENSGLVSSYIERAKYKEPELTLSEDFVPGIIKCTIVALAEAARERISKETPVATIIDDLEGNTLLACLVSFIPNEEKEEDKEESVNGHWRCDFTFNDEDIPENARRYKLSDGKLDRVFMSVSKRYNFEYVDTPYVYFLAEVFASTLIEYLDGSATPDTEVNVVLEDYFTAKVQVIDDVKVMSFTPFGAIVKKAIKSDADLEE